MDLPTIFTSAGIMVVGQTILYLGLRRPLEKVQELEAQIRELRDQDLEDLRAGQQDDAAKRKAIYQRLENVEVNYRRNEDCQRMHQEIPRLQQAIVDTTIRLERVAAIGETLVKRMDEITHEQVSLGKDLSDLSARMEERKP